jgi:hypothetical protein
MIPSTRASSEDGRVSPGRSVLRIIQIELHSPPAREKHAPWLLGAEKFHTPQHAGRLVTRRARALTCYQTTARHF